MPGPQLRQAIPFTEKIKEQYPECITIWGGYFASNQFKVSIESSFVDYIINGPGDQAFPALIEFLEAKCHSDQNLNDIKNLIYKNSNGEIVKTPKEELLDQDSLPPLPYKYLDSFYRLENYLSKTFLGRNTFSYHSSL